MTAATKLYDYLRLSDEALLDKRIFKKMFQENGQLSAADKRVLSEDVDQILWKYALKPDTVQIGPYADDEREYLEVAVIDVQLGNRQGLGRIAAIVHRSIPYPVLLVLSDSSGFVVSLAPKRFSLVDKGRIVAEEFLMTPWIEPPLSEIDRLFLESLSMRELSQVNFYAFYQDLVARVLARNCAALTSKFQLGASDLRGRAQTLEECRTLERELAAMKAAIRKDIAFAEKVELNTRIKKLQFQLDRALETL